jgi:hypothetical protein
MLSVVVGVTEGVTEGVTGVTLGDSVRLSVGKLTRTGDGKEVTAV